MNCFFCKKEIKKNDIQEGNAVKLNKDGSRIAACTSHNGVIEEKERQEGKRDV